MRTMSSKENWENAFIHTCRSHYWRSTILTHFQIWRCTRLILTSPSEANSNSKEKRCEKSVHTHTQKSSMAEHNLLTFPKLTLYRININIFVKSEEKQRIRKTGKNSFLHIYRSHNLSSIQFYLQFEDHRISFKCFSTDSYEDYFQIKVTNA